MGRRKPSTKRWQGRGGCLAEACAVPLAVVFVAAEWPPVPWLVQMQQSMFYGHSSPVLSGALVVAFLTGLSFVAWFAARRVILVVERRRRGDATSEPSPSKSAASSSSSSLDG